MNAVNRDGITILDVAKSLVALADLRPSWAAAENFRHCLTDLADRSSDTKSVEVLRDACEAAELLTSDRLYVALGAIGGLDFTESSRS